MLTAPGRFRTKHSNQSFYLWCGPRGVRFLLAVLALLASGVLSGPQAAEAPAGGTFTPPLYEPATINIYADAGQGEAPLPRSFSLESAAPQDLDYTPTALRQSNNGPHEIPPGRLTLHQKDAGDAPVTRISLAAHSPKTVHLKLDRSGLPAGEYSGQLRFRTRMGTPEVEGSFGLPVVVRIRHALLMPALVLAIGLGLGMSLSWYRTQRLASDELLVRIAETEVIAKEVGFKTGEQNYEAFAGLLRRATVAVDLKKPVEAQTHLDTAIKLLTDFIASTPALPGLDAAGQAAASASLAGKAEAAAANLRIFRGASYAVAMFFLGAAGMKQLYFENPVFGVNGIIDYLPLLAWGFGSHATTAAISQLLASWNLPGINRPPVG